MCDLDLSWSRNVIDHVTNRFAIGYFYWLSIVTKSLSLSVFEIFDPQNPCAHTHRHTPQVIFIFYILFLFYFIFYFYILRRYNFVKLHYILSHAMYCIGQTEMPKNISRFTDTFLTFSAFCTRCVLSLRFFLRSVHYQPSVFGTDVNK